jgi:PAS domain S-box-containing protein
MTGQGTVQTAVEAMKIGAFDYVLKPFKVGAILPVLSRCIEVRRLRLENIQLKETVEIYNLSKVVALTLDANAIVSKIAEGALEQCGAEEVSIMLPTEDGKELYITTIRGNHREFFLGQRISIEQGIAGWVARNHEIVMLNGEVRDHRFKPVSPRPDISSSVSIPMMAGGKLVGILNVNVTKSRRQLSFGQVKGLSILVGMAAPALENARLFSQVRQAKEEWERTFDAIIDPIMILDTEYRITKANKAMADKLGVAPSGAEGLTCYKEVHGRDGPIPLCPHSESLVDGKTHTTEVYEERIGGHFLISASPLYTPDGVLYGVVHSAHDITERKLAEEMLAKSEERYRRLVESVTDYIYSVKVENGHAISTAHGPACAAVTGYTVEEYNADPDLWRRMVYEEDLGAVMEQSRHILAGNIPPPVEHRIIHKDGSIRWMSNTSVPSFDKEGQLVAYDGMITDITERRRLQEKLREYAETLEGKVRKRTRQLEDANNEFQILNNELVLRRKEADEAKNQADAATQAKSDFLASMSHELRTPLNSIIGFSEVLKKGMFGLLTEKQDEFVGYVIGSGKHLLDLINDILDLSKVEAGKVNLELTTFNLPEILNASLFMLREKALKHGIAMKLDIAPGADIVIEADMRRVKQILFNLLSNAVKFTPDGGSVHVTARRGSDGDFVEISVEDTGIGIKEEDMPNLFKEFSQIESSYDKKYEGTGLGLALTKKLVELHGGRIWCESEYGKGSRFAFVLPVQQLTKELPSGGRS